ncbi:MAG: hypothetical protein QNI84_09885 [Henriciella sp.]|nr:hypothetical protein [Henriciella sp.]
MRNISLLVASLWLGACQVTVAPVPAVLDPSDPAAVEALKQSLAEAVGKARVELGPEDLATSSSVSVLPAPLNPNETHSLAMPEQFDIVIEDGACRLIHRKSGETYPLKGATCRPA